MRNPNWDNIMVKAENNGTAIVLHTYERQYGRSSGFYIITEHLRKWYANDPELIFHDADGVSTIKMWCKGQTCHIQISWLHFHADRELRGHVQRFTIPERALRHLMIDGASIRELCRPEERRAKIDASHAGKVLKQIRQNKLLRRAFSKAMRREFHWPDDEVTLYSDWNSSFYFVTKSGFPANGGLVLHEGVVRENGVMRTRYYYSVHT